MTREDLKTLAAVNNMTEDAVIDAILAAVKKPFVDACISLKAAQDMLMEAMKP